MKNFRQAKLSGGFVRVARAALAEANGDAAVAGSILYALARERHEFFKMAEIARVALGVMAPADGVPPSARAVLENELAAKEPPSRA